MFWKERLTLLLLVGCLVSETTSQTSGFFRSLVGGTDKAVHTYFDQYFEKKPLLLKFSDRCVRCILTSSCFCLSFRLNITSRGVRSATPVAKFGKPLAQYDAQNDVAYRYTSTYEMKT